METVFVAAFVEADGALAPASLESISAASSLGGGAFVVGLVGGNVEPALAQLKGGGATKVLVVQGEPFAEPHFGTDAAAVAALARAAGATVIVAASSPRASRVMPAVAFRLGGKADTHVTGLTASEQGIIASRWFYRQRLEGKLTRSERPWVLVLESGASPAHSPSAGGAAPPVEHVEVDVPSALLRTKVTGRRTPPPDQQTIHPDADLLFVAGAGWTKKQADGQVHGESAERLILDFIRQSRASLGSSKSLVDVSCEGGSVLSFLTHMNQVGQTGATPRHPKGLSTCCHGEEPHAVGWRFVRERRAVNLDANCGWARGKADVLYVADAFAVVEKLNELLSSRK